MHKTDRQKTLLYENNTMSNTQYTNILNNYNKYSNNKCITDNAFINNTWNKYNTTLNNCAVICNSYSNNNTLCNVFTYDNSLSQCIIWYDVCIYEINTLCILWSPPCTYFNMIGSNGFDSYIIKNTDYNEYDIYILLAFGTIILLFIICCVSCMHINKCCKCNKKDRINSVKYLPPNINDNDNDECYNVIITDTNNDLYHNIPIAKTTNIIVKQSIPFALT